MRSVRRFLPSYYVIGGVSEEEIEPGKQRLRLRKINGKAMNELIQEMNSKSNNKKTEKNKRETGASAPFCRLIVAAKFKWICMRMKSSSIPIQRGPKYNAPKESQMEEAHLTNNCHVLFAKLYICGVRSWQFLAWSPRGQRPPKKLRSKEDLLDKNILKSLA